ncbi:TPA: hypothetical protein N2G40_002099 [Salmonella enterica]|nr:hypothetical protein [Salmonella enterica]
MDNSSYVKMVLKSNKQIAIAVDKGIDAFIREFKKSTHQISLGVERLSWYTSCGLTNYQNECRQLEHEDLRMGYCIVEFFLRKDPIADMILICVKYLLNFYSRKERIRILAEVYNVFSMLQGENISYQYPVDNMQYNSINDCDDILNIHADSPESRQLLESLAYVCNLSTVDLIKDSFLSTDGIISPAKISTDMVARKTLAYTFAKTAARSMSLTLSLRTKLNNGIVYFVTSAYYYGIVQKAASSAKKLKIMNPEYYSILYNNKLEMFFFLIEPYIPPELYYPSFFIGNPDAATSFLKKLLK